MQKKNSNNNNGKVTFFSSTLLRYDDDIICTQNAKFTRAGRQTYIHLNIKWFNIYSSNVVRLYRQRHTAIWFFFGVGMEFIIWSHILCVCVRRISQATDKAVSNYACSVRFIGKMWRMRKNMVCKIKWNIIYLRVEMRLDARCALLST